MKPSYSPLLGSQALRQLGAIQMLNGAEDDAETSLLRAARLGSTSADQGKARDGVRTRQSSRKGRALLQWHQCFKKDTGFLLIAHVRLTTFTAPARPRVCASANRGCF